MKERVCGSYRRYRTLVISRKHCSDNTKCSSWAVWWCHQDLSLQVSAITWPCKVFIGKVQKITSTSVWILLKATAVREDHSVVSLRVHTNIHSGLTKIVSIRPVQQCPVTDVLKDDRMKFSIPYMVSDDPKLGWIFVWFLFFGVANSFTNNFFWWAAPSVTTLDQKGNLYRSKQSICIFYSFF